MSNSEATATRPVSGMKVFFRLLGYARPYAPWLVIGILCLSADISFSVAIAWVQETFLDTINAGDVDYLMYLVRVSAMVSIGAMIVMVGGAFIRYWIVALMDRDVAVSAFDHVNRLPFGYVEGIHSGDLVSRASSDVGQATQVIGNSAFSLINNMGVCLLAFFYLSDIDLPLALLTVGSGPIIFAVGRFFDGRIRKLSKTIQDQNAHLRGMQQETLQGMAVVKAFGLEQQFAQKYAQERQAAFDMAKRRSLLNAAMWRSVGVTNGLLTVVSVFLIALAAMRGSLTVGSLLAFVILMGRVQWPFVGLSTTWGSVQQGLGAADRVFAMMDHASEPDGSPEMAAGVTPVATARPAKAATTEATVTAATPATVATPTKPLISATTATTAAPTPATAESAECALKLTNVSFSYSEGTLFSGLNLCVKPGEIVAVVGPSGGGKTTLAQICCGLRDLEQGDVEVFGMSLRSERSKARSLLAYVPQTPYLFAGTIGENISYGREGATMEEVIEAAKAANAHDFIDAMEKKYDTAIGELGTTLSGGERQRIALARAFLRDAPLIILDEATSSLDNESEKLVQESMDRLMQGRTALVIAHRLSTVRNASRILVMDAGKIVEEGTHSELMAKQGLYARLYTIQFRDSEGAAGDQTGDGGLGGE